jgi:AcrR family transcriptional regulator
MPKTKPGRAEQARRTRAALIAAGRQLFGARGYHATGTHDLVAQAQVTRGALYHHFPAKEDLFLAVFHAVQQDLLQMSETVAVPAAEQNGWLRFRAEMHNFLRAAATASEIQRILLIDGPAVLGWQEWRRLEAHYALGMITKAVEEGIAAGLIRRGVPPRTMAHFVLSVIDEAALLVANATDAEAATRDAEAAIDALLTNLA